MSRSDGTSKGTHDAVITTTVTKRLRIAAIVVAVVVIIIIIRVATSPDDAIERSGTVGFVGDKRICLAPALDELLESGMCYILDEDIEVADTPGDVGVRTGDQVTVLVVDGSEVEGSESWDTVVELEVLQESG